MFYDTSRYTLRPGYIARTDNADIQIVIDPDQYEPTQPFSSIVEIHIQPGTIEDVVSLESPLAFCVF